MKSIILKSVWAFALITLLFSCKKDETLRDTKVTEVKNLYAPLNNANVELQSEDGVSTYFEWEPAKAEDSGMILYEVAFDEVGGDFSDPIYKMASDNNGAYNHATITHKTLDQILEMSGVKRGEIGKVIWTVISSKGINELKSPEIYTLEVKRLIGFTGVNTAFLTGSATEGGDKIENAIAMKSLGQGVFELYTKLEQGKTYHFVNKKEGDIRQFFIENGILREGASSTTVEKTGVYRIKVDFSVASSNLTEITDFQLFFCPTNSFLFSMNYVGNGVWKATNQPITFKQENWGRDERYKFKMSTITKTGQSSEEWWGTPNTDSRPSPTEAPSYYYLFPVDNSQWNGKFKFAGEMDNALVDVTMYFQADKPYTHEVVKVGNQ